MCIGYMQILLPFYTRDLNILAFWYPQGVLEPIPTERQLYKPSRLTPLHKALQLLPIATIKHPQFLTMTLKTLPNLASVYLTPFSSSQCSNALISFCPLNTPSLLPSGELSTCTVFSCTWQSSSQYFTWMPLSPHISQDSIPYLDRLSYINPLSFTTVWNYFVYFYIYYLLFPL